MAEAMYSSDFFWDNVFFKVEEKLFCVPRSQFERSSEVFAHMFSLPAENPEGRDKEHPIVLEKYNADEFTCLLKVMYPTAESLISGTSIGLRLEKGEWMSVLKLSTIWNMNKIRDYAIHRLSTDIILTSIEKIQLARAYQVAKWLEEGVASLVSPDNTSTRDELVVLGYKTAFEILWIQNQSLKKSPETLRFRKDSIKCPSCSSSSSLLDGTDNCRQCGEFLAADEELGFPGPGSNSEISALDRIVHLGSIKCSKCSQNSFYGMSSFHCPACSSYITYNTHIRVTPKREATETIKEIFGKEIKGYQLISSAT